MLQIGAERKALAEVHYNTVHKMKAKVCRFLLQNLELRRNNTKKYVHRTYDQCDKK